MRTTGANMYEFADHGGLTMLAPLSKPSQNVSWSWNQGASWDDCTFANSNIQVFPLLRPSILVIFSFLFFSFF